jgi:hypothetical protein
MRLWSVVVISNALQLCACSAGAHALVATSHDSISVAPPSGTPSIPETAIAGAHTSGSAAGIETRIPLAADVRTRFHVSFREDGARWADDEVTAVRDALAMLDARERAEIEGTTFVRNRATPVTIGGAQAQAVHRVGVYREAGRPHLLQEVQLTDSAVLLRHDALVAMTLHELGHVIEQGPRNRARLVVMTAEADLERQRAEAWTVDRLFVKEYAAATGRISALSGADLDAASDFVAVLESSALAYAGLRDVPELADADFDRARAQREAELSAMLARRDRARTRLATTAPANPALPELAHALELENTAVAAVRTWSQLRSRVRAAAARLAAVSAAGDLSTRLHGFIATMDAHRVGPISDYTAKIRVVEKPAQFHIEMFAESFSLWKTDRRALQRVAPQLAAWFDEGNHLK